MKAMSRRARVVDVGMRLAGRWCWPAMISEDLHAGHWSIVRCETDDTAGIYGL